MSCVHFVGGEKGGVGKSVFARLLCQWLLDDGANLSALDGGSDLNLFEFESADQIMDRALGAERQVAVDLPSKSHRALTNWIVESDVESLA